MSDDNANDGGDEQSLEDMVQDLVVRVQTLEAKRDQVLEPKIDEQEQTINELSQRVEELEAENTQLRAELDSLGELGADKQSTPKKRVLDLRQLLLNKAKADYESGGDGMIAWTYGQVIDGLEANGHGKVYPAQAYSAMEDAAEADGFGHGENQSDETVVRVNWTAVPAHGAVNEINNAQGVTGPDQAPAND